RYGSTTEGTYLTAAYRGSPRKRLIRRDLSESPMAGRPIVRNSGTSICPDSTLHRLVASWTKINRGSREEIMVTTSWLTTAWRTSAGLGTVDTVRADNTGVPHTHYDGATNGWVA